MGATAFAIQSHCFADYQANSSDDNFNHLVREHIDLVFAAAKRQTHDEHLAEDVTQAVFILLHRKARSLSPSIVLEGWLINATRYIAQNAVRAAARRHYHEKKAAEMNASINRPSCDDEEIAEQLDAALSSLPARDRDAIVLRYLKGQSIATVAATIGSTEGATHKRITRALERLSSHFRKQGIVAPAIAIEASLYSHGPVPAPSHLSSSVSQAIAHGSPSASNLLTTGVIVMATITKTQITAIIVTAALLLIGTTIAFIWGTSSRPSVAATASIPPNTIRISAYIDGISRLRIRGNTIQWHHLEYAPPGMHGGANRPTLINREKWKPQWPQDTSGETMSSIYDKLNPPLPQEAVKVELKPIKVREKVSVVQEPTAENDYTLIVEFDDSSNAGPADYVVEIKFAPAPKEAASPATTQRAT